MRRGYRVLGAGWLLLTGLASQPEFFGYLESELDQVQFQQRTYNFGYNKLRLDFEARPSDPVLIGGNLNIQRYFGRTTWNLLDFLPEEVWKPLFQPPYLPDSLWVTEWPITLPDTIYLDNLYLKARFEHFDLTVGKQQISPGTGYAWNPTDVFNRKDLLDPTYEQTGVTAVRVEVPLRSRLTLDVVIAPGESWSRTTKMVQSKIGLGRFDLIPTYIRQYHLFPYWRVMDITATRKVLDLIGGSLVGQVGEFGLWGEGLWTLESGVYQFGEFLLGADHTFDSGTYLMGEYFHNSLGATRDELSFSHYLYYFEGETHSLMQNYLFTFVSHPFTDLVTVSLLGIFNLDDESGAVNPQVDWNLFEDVNLSLFYSFLFGAADSEFGIQKGYWRLRLRAYF
jgi:hypothetical protein